MRRRRSGLFLVPHQTLIIFGTTELLTLVKYLSGRLDMELLAFAILAAFSISLSLGSVFPTLRLSLTVPKNSKGSCETASMFFLRNLRSRSLMLWLLIKFAPAKYKLDQYLFIHQSNWLSHVGWSLSDSPARAKQIHMSKYLKKGILEPF